MDKKSRRNGRRSRVEPYAWLGAGALTLGIGAALASGAAVAHADAKGAEGSSGRGPSATSGGPGNSHSPSSARKPHLQTTSATAVPSKVAPAKFAGIPSPSTRAVSGSAANEATATATPAPNTPPVISSVALGVPNSKTGAVVGTVTATDANGNKLTYKATTSGNGKVTITSAGVFTYTPTAKARHAAGKLGPGAPVTADVVTVTVSDGKGGTATATASVPITPANAVPTVTKKVGTPNATTGMVTGTVKGADSDKDTLTYTVTAAPSKGAVTITSAGAFTYTPSAAARHAAAKVGASAAVKTDTFTVTIADGYGGSVASAVTVTISPTNSAPTGTVSIAKADPITGIAKGTITISDTDKDTVTYTATKPANGTVVVNVDGSFIYTPTAAARANARKSTTAVLDKFTITAADGYGGTKVLSVTATIAPTDAAPVATVSIDPANPTNGVVTGQVKATDPDGDPITYVPGTFATPGGTVTITATGQFTYTPTVKARQDAAKANNPSGSVSGFSNPNRVVFSPDGKLAYVSNTPTAAYPKGAISVVDVATNTIVGTISGTSTAVLSGDALAISPDGKRLYASYRSGRTMSVIDTATNTVTATIPGYFAALTVSPDGSRVYALADQNVSVINSATNTVITTMKIAGSSGAIAVSPDGDHLYVALGAVNTTDPGTVLVFNTNTFASEAVIAAPAGSFDVDVSPDGKRTYVTGYYGIQIIDNSTNKIISTNLGFRGLSYSAMKFDGARFYTTFAATVTILIADATATNLLAKVNGGSGAQTDIAVSPDGRRAYVVEPWMKSLLVLNTADTDGFVVKAQDKYGATTNIVVSVPISLIKVA